MFDYAVYMKKAKAVWIANTVITRLLKVPKKQTSTLTK